MFLLRRLYRKLFCNQNQLYTIKKKCNEGNNELRLKRIGIQTVVPSKIISTATMSENGIKFIDYNCLGFDLDNTICRYKIGSMLKLEYEAMATFLIKERGYLATHLLRPMEDNLDFMLKGLILDTENGNILRIASDGHIMHGSHGTTELTRQDLINYYGLQCRWLVTDEFTRDPLHTWNGPHTQKMRTLLDYFDMPAGLIFARAVDSLDEQNGGPLKSYSIWPDLLDALQHIFLRDHFQLDKGKYFQEIKANPQQYIHKCSNNLINWFKALRERNKILFLITGSNVDFASHTAVNSMGPNWQELFDIVICFAKKPGFFTSNRPFIGLNGFEETVPVDPDDLQLSQIYNCGNWDGLHKFLKKHSKCENPKIVYFGDNLVQDIYTPAVHSSIDTVAICEELQAEGVFGHQRSHGDESFLVSSIWGSYFSHKTDKKNSIWHEIIQKHAKTCIPSLEYVANKPLEHEYVNIQYK